MSVVPGIEGLAIGSQVRIHCTGAPAVIGRLESAADGWLGVSTSEGLVRVRAAAVATVLVYPQAAQSVDEGPGRPRAKEITTAPGTRAPARPWSDGELRRLADAFLDGTSDADLAAAFQRTRNQITVVHHAFECARGNLNEDDLGDVAKGWVPRLRKVLAGPP